MSNIYNALYNLSVRLHGDELGGRWYPVPPMLRAALSRMSKRGQIVGYTKMFAGYDLTAYAPNALGCAEAVSRVICQVFPDFGIYTGTAQLDAIFRIDTRFRKLSAGEEIQPGDIIISPTGSGNGKVAHGHTGIFVENKRIYSNDSATGKWIQNWTDLSWRAYFVGTGGFPVNIYRVTV